MSVGGSSEPAPGTTAAMPVPVPAPVRLALAWLGWLERAVCILGFIGITGALFADLLSRELLGRGIFGAQRFAVYCMVVVAFVAFALAIEWRAHLGIEAAERLVPRAWNAAMERVSDVVAALGCAFLGYWSWRFVAGSFADGSRGQGLEVILWPIQSVLIWCFASGTLRHLAYAVWPASRAEAPAVKAVDGGADPRPEAST